MRAQTLVLDLISKKRLPDQNLSQTQPNPNNLPELFQSHENPKLDRLIRKSLLDWFLGQSEKSRKARS